jgi:hypothetical protein
MAEQIPSVGRTVHYVLYGTPGGEYTSECRAAIITAVDADSDGEIVDLCVLNPTGMFFNRDTVIDEGAETPGDLQCPNISQHGNPFRYCACGWQEAKKAGGTWHWPERT